MLVFSPSSKHLQFIGVTFSVMFHLTWVHIFKLCLVAQWPPFGK